LDSPFGPFGDTLAPGASIAPETCSRDKCGGALEPGAHHAASTSVKRAKLQPKSEKPSPANANSSFVPDHTPP